MVEPNKLHILSRRPFHRRLHQGSVLDPLVHSGSPYNTGVRSSFPDYIMEL